MNIYSKFAPNVFVAKCDQPYQKGDVVILTSKYGKETSVIIHNLVDQKDNYYFYSFFRTDGLTSQDFALKKAARYQTYAGNAMNRSNDAFKAANKHSDFLRLGEPIKVGHHSERKHRALFEKNAKLMDRCVDEMNKADDYKHKAEYWIEKSDKIDLSMPESVEYFEFKLEEAIKIHQAMKENPDLREHPCSLSYAKKDVNNFSKQLELAKKLWA